MHRKCKYTCVYTVSNVFESICVYFDSFLPLGHYVIVFNHIRYVCTHLLFCKIFQWRFQQPFRSVIGKHRFLLDFKAYLTLQKKRIDKQETWWNAFHSVASVCVCVCDFGFDQVFYLSIFEFAFSIQLEIENVCKIFCTVVAQNLETFLKLPICLYKE